MSNAGQLETRTDKMHERSILLFCLTNNLGQIWTKTHKKCKANAFIWSCSSQSYKCKHCSHIINRDNWWWKSIISIFQNFILKFSFLSKCIRFYPVFLFHFSGQMQHFQEEMSILHIIFKVFSCECGGHIYVLPINYLFVIQHSSDSIHLCISHLSYLC